VAMIGSAQVEAAPWRERLGQQKGRFDLAIDRNADRRCVQ
jgi:hypothetical protein